MELVGHVVVGAVTGDLLRESVTFWSETSSLPGNGHLVKMRRPCNEGFAMSSGLSSVYSAISVEGADGKRASSPELVIVACRHWFGGFDQPNFTCRDQ